MKTLEYPVVVEMANEVRDAIKLAATAAQDADTLRKALVDSVRNQGGWINDLQGNSADITVRIETTTVKEDGEDIITVLDGNVVQVQFRMNSKRVTEEEKNAFQKVLGPHFGKLFVTSQELVKIGSINAVVEWLRERLTSVTLDHLSTNGKAVTVSAEPGTSIPGLDWRDTWSTTTGFIDKVKELPTEVWEEAKGLLLPLIEGQLSPMVVSGNHADFEKKAKK